MPRFSTEIRLLPFRCIAILLCCIPAAQVSGQGLLEKVSDFFEIKLRKPLPGEPDTVFVPKIVVAPVVTYKPTTNVGLGVGAKLLFRPKGAGYETRTINIPIGMTYTLRNQFIFSSGFTVFFPEEKWLVRGRLSYRDFPINFYPSGPLTSGDDYTEIQYQQIRIEPLLLRRIGEAHAYFGGGFRYNTFFDVTAETKEDEVPVPRTLLDRLEATAAGFEFAGTVDTRDNVLNAYNGRLLEVTHGFYGEVLGGTHQFMLSKIDYRGYVQPFSGRKDVFAYQLYGRYAWGDAPELEQSDIGGSRLMRGWRESRWRGQLAYVAQAEYRWQTWDNIGFVFFGSAGDVSDPGETTANFSTLKYGVGAGVRFRIVESERLNVRIDYGRGFGQGTSSGFYLGIAEAF